MFPLANVLTNITVSFAGGISSCIRVRVARFPNIYVTFAHSHYFKMVQNEKSN